MLFYNFFTINLVNNKKNLFYKMNYIKNKKINLCTYLISN